ncbi:hypothetical protein ACQEU3_21010 [Spirillospora sp. CA-253888]
MTTTMVLAQAAAGSAPTGVGMSLLFGPLIIALALVTWLALVGFASWPGAHPSRGYDQSPHRGPAEGGMYHYRPGMFSHSDVGTTTRKVRKARPAKTAQVTEYESVARPSRSTGATRM